MKLYLCALYIKLYVSRTLVCLPGYCKFSDGIIFVLDLHCQRCSDLYPVIISVQMVNFYTVYMCTCHMHTRMHARMRRCSSVCEQFPYLVEFSGVGHPPPDCVHGLDDVGYCTQIAIFTRAESGMNL